MSTTHPSPGAGTPPPATNFETHGIDTIPGADRSYSPVHVLRILMASNLCFSVIVVGWLVVGFGLGWWSALSSVVVGCIVGGIALGPMGLFGPRTGTNNAVSSGAHFGVGGRMLGTLLALASALGFVALTVWTSGDALVGGLHRAVGLPASDGYRAVAYAIIAVVVLGVAARGIHLLIRVQQVVGPIVAIVMLIGVVAFAPDFHASYSGGTYLLGGFGATWVLAALVSASTVISYGPFIGDWARYVAPSATPGRLMLATGVGGALGIGLPAIWGVYVASTFASTSSTGSFVLDLVASSPSWYVVGILLIGLVAGSAQGAVGLYGTGLDTSSLIPALSRVRATILIALVASGLVYLGTFVWDAQASVSAFLIVLVVLIMPWMVILAIGYWWRRGFYLADDLQVFTRGQRGGRYWFSGGVNWRALGAWIPAAIVGVLFAAAPPLYTGPWANAANGVDLSFLSAGVIGGVLYVVLLVAFPEPREVFGPEGPRLGGDRGRAGAPAPLATTASSVGEEVNR